MKQLSYSIQSDSLQIQNSRGWMILKPYSPVAVRIRYRLDPNFSDKESLIIQCPPPNGVEFKVKESPEGLIFSTREMGILIDWETSAFTYLDPTGNCLTREPSRGGKTLEPIDVLVSDFTQATIIGAESVDGLRFRIENEKKVVDRQAYHTKLEFEWTEGEALYGLGSHEEGMLNLRGQHQYLYQQNMKVSVPVLISTRGYGVLLDSCSLVTFHDDAFGSYLWTDVDDELDYFFVYGPEFDRIIHEVRLLTGKAPMFPKWVFGYVQSKERYESQDELLSIVREYRQRKLPLDCIVLDWKSWPGDLWGQKTLDPSRFPDPHQMTAELHALHTRLMISIWPIMRPGGQNWEEMHERGFLLGDLATYNAFNPEARACYWKQARDGLFSKGIDAWWCDCTEPFEADWHGAIKPEPEERLWINTAEAKRFLDPELINAYSLVHSEGIYSGQRVACPEKRVVNLTRSAIIGQQRYATITWSGDVSATWETLKNQIPAALNFCVTGLPYWTVDVGGFFVKNRPDLWFWRGDFDEGVADLGYRELYVRWFQWATFLPILRSHGTDTPREIWRFGEPGEAFYEALVRFLDLRYRLLPYIYSLAGWVTHADYTILRLLAFDFREDPQVYDLKDQYMFGPTFLVAPITRPMIYGPGSMPLKDTPQNRPVYLPRGWEWYDFWTNQRLMGGQSIFAPAPIDRIPIYVRSGSILPMGPSQQYVDERPGASLELHVYAGHDGEFLLYEDEGDGYNYEHGAYSIIPVHWQDNLKCLTIGQREGSFPGMIVQREFEITLHGGQLIGSDEQIDRKVVLYTGESIQVWF